MGDQFKPIITKQEGRTVVSGARGSQAGKSFAGTEELERQKAVQQFLTEQGWAGLGGAAKRPANWEQQFETWYTKKKKPAPAPTPSPTPTPAASTKVGGMLQEALLNKKLGLS